MALTRFDPPGFLDDLNDEGKQAWSDWISTQLDEARDRDGLPELVNYGPRPQFFNPLRTAPGPDAAEQDITWSAFPRIVAITSVSAVQRWRRADSSRDRQDEYCEWSVDRDPDSNKIRRVTFTSEGPEYWQFLAQIDPDRVLALYREHVSAAVRPEHLFSSNGRYNPVNRWNNSTDQGAMHLIQRNNTLGAEIELAAAATLVRNRGGVPVTTEQDLIQCGQYGQAERHSDPHIGAQVNALARQKADVTLANPVGLCIAGFAPDNTWETPDHSDPARYWRITRGTKEKALRAVFEVPAGKDFVVGDITVNGRAIEFGAQIADFITIKLTGLATRFGQSTAEAVACVAEAELGGPAPLSVAAALARAASASR